MASIDHFLANIRAVRSPSGQLLLAGEWLTKGLANGIENPREPTEEEIESNRLPEGQYCGMYGEPPASVTRLISLDGRDIVISSMNHCHYCEGTHWAWIQSGGRPSRYQPGVSMAWEDSEEEYWFCWLDLDTVGRFVDDTVNDLRERP